jgi:hypothetical protein
LPVLGLRAAVAQPRKSRGRGAAYDWGSSPVFHSTVMQRSVRSDAIHDDPNAHVGSIGNEISLYAARRPTIAVGGAREMNFLLLQVAHPQRLDPSGNEADVCLAAQIISSRSRKVALGSGAVRDRR